MSRSFWPCGIVLSSVVTCAPLAARGQVAPAGIGSNADPSPTVSFLQIGLAVGLNRANEPASAAACATGGDTLSYGTWLADFDGDGRLDVYDVNHGQACHLSGLWLGRDSTTFGQNLYTVAFQSAPDDGASLGISNEVKFVGDLTGDGLPDIYLLDWVGLGAMCVNQGSAAHADWTGPSFVCYQAWAPITFADVDGDGRMDIETLDPATTYDVYRDRCRTLPTLWHLNNGNPDINTWPTDSNPFHFVGRGEPGALLDVDGDGLPDRIVGVELPDSQRGPYANTSGGLQLSLGQNDGTYRAITSGLEIATDPISTIEDIDGDGCLDVGTDPTQYRDNQSWFVQDRSGGRCLATFHSVPRTALAYYPGYRRYTVDVDNDGLLDKVVIVHVGYGNNDGVAGGVHIFRQLIGGGYQDLGGAGIRIDGLEPTEFYADELSPGDWNGDGRLDFAGVGPATIPGTDSGVALWTSALATTNRSITVRLPDVSGVFTSTATIEVFDAGFAGDSSHLVTPPVVLRAGRAWASRSYLLGVGTRTTVDVRVTFPDGRRATLARVSTGGSVTVRAPAATHVPAMTGWGAILTALMLAAVGVRRLRLIG